jgi:hypothetical protein
MARDNEIGVETSQKFDQRFHAQDVRRSVRSTYPRLTPDQRRRLMAARAVMVELQEVVSLDLRMDMAALAEYCCLVDTWPTPEQRKHLDGCDNKDCETQYCQFVWWEIGCVVVDEE